jgi:hypothetical protein
MTPCEVTRACLQEWLDQSPSLDQGIPASCGEHLSNCPSCRALAQGFEMLRQAIPDLREPIPRPEATHRWIHASASSLQTRAAGPILAPRVHKWMARGGAVAASLGLLLGLWWLTSGRNREEATALPSGKPPAPLARSVTEVLADAGEATAVLVREASEPAARISRGVLVQAAPPPDAPLDAAPLSGGGWPLMGEPWDLRHVGARLGDRIRPLTDRAQAAFGFLSWPRPRSVSGADGA